MKINTINISQFITSSGRCLHNEPSRHYESFLYYFLHFYIVTVFEILFYIYYIFPYENLLFYKLFYSYIDKYLHAINNEQLHNIVNTMITNATMTEYYENCERDIDRIYYYDEKIFMTCKIYILCIHLVFLCIFAYELHFMYTRYVDNGEPTIEHSIHREKNIMSEINSQFLCDEKNEGNDEISLTLENKKQEGQHVAQHKSRFFVYYYQHSSFLKEFVRTAKFILLIGVFEYLFFTDIIKKVKIVDMNIIVCKVVKSIDE